MVFDAAQSPPTQADQTPARAPKMFQTDPKILIGVCLGALVFIWVFVQLGPDPSAPTHATVENSTSTECKNYREFLKTYDPTDPIQQTENNVELAICKEHVDG